MADVAISIYEGLDENGKPCWVVIDFGKAKVFLSLEKFSEYVASLKRENRLFSAEAEALIIKITSPNSLDNISTCAGLD